MVAISLSEAFYIENPKPSLNEGIKTSREVDLFLWNVWFTTSITSCYVIACVYAFLALILYKLSTCFNLRHVTLKLITNNVWPSSWRTVKLKMSSAMIFENKIISITKNNILNLTMLSWGQRNVVSSLLI